MKNIRIIITSILLMIILASTLLAGTITLYWATPNNYVTTWHGDMYWDDLYVGTASNRKTEYQWVSQNRVAQINWTRISYDVQGTWYVATANSRLGYTDKRVIRVKDLWNLSKVKTKVYYNYNRTVLDEGVLPYYVSIDR